MLTTGAIVFFSAVAGNFSQSWLIATGHYRGRMIEYGVWAGGAFVIGLGVLPVVAALAGLVRPKDEERTPALRAFTALLLAALLCFGLYTAVKASYLSTSFGTVIVERNLIYLVPLVFVGTALWLERPRLRWIPLAAATGFVAYLLVSANYALENVPYSDALGLAIAQMSNRNLSFTDNAVQWALIVTLAVSVLLLVLPRLLGARRTAVRAVVGVTAALVLAWTLTGQISAAKYSNDSGDLITRNYPKPLTWLDDITGGEPVVYLGQNINAGAALGIWLTEFWNRSLKHVWSLDGTAPGPGPGAHARPRGHGRPALSRPGRAYVLAERGVDVDGDARRATAQDRPLVRLQAQRALAPRARRDGHLRRRLDGGGERVQPVRVAERPGREHGREARPVGLGRPRQARPRADPRRDARQGRGQAAAHR